MSPSQICLFTPRLVALDEGVTISSDELLAMHYIVLYEQISGHDGWNPVPRRQMFEALIRLQISDRRLHERLEDGLRGLIREGFLCWENQCYCLTKTFLKAIGVEKEEMAVA